MNRVYPTPTLDLDSLRGSLDADPAASRVLELVEGEARVQVDVTGLRGSSSALLVAAAAEVRSGPVLVVCKRNEAAEDLAEDLEVLCPGSPVHVMPGPEILPYEPTDPDPDLVGRRMLGLDRLHRGEPGIYVTSVRGLLQRVPGPERLEALVLEIRKGDRLDLDRVEAWLEETGYHRFALVEDRGHFSLRGGILDVFPASADAPVRVELFDDEVESIRRFDVETQRSQETLDAYRILAARPFRFRVDPAAMADRAGAWEGAADRVGVLAAELEENPHRAGLDHYAPYFEDLVPLTRYLCGSSLLVWDRAEELEERFAAHFSEMKRYFEEMIAEEPDLPPPPHLFLTPAELARTSATFPSVTVWELPPSSGAPFRDLARLTWFPGGAGEEPGGEPGDRAAAEPGPAATPEPAAEPDRVRVALALQKPGSYRGRLARLRKDLEERVGDGYRILLYCDNEGQAERMAEILEETADGLLLPVGHLSGGFIWPAIRLAVLTDHEVFDRYRFRYRPRAVPRRMERLDYQRLRPGDFVVHVTHGIARYHGLEVLCVDSRETECLVLRYQGGDRLFVPIDQLHLVEKYVAKEGVEPVLSKLGGAAWTRTKARARKVIEDMAGELLELYARREVRRGHTFSQDTNWQREFEAAFIYEETPHQARAAGEVKVDMEEARPMDRLICGDVGYGKTEVAMRAAFKAVQDGKQVAVLVPTTILAQQHFNTFGERFADYPLKIEMLSRFRSAKEQKKILEEVARGEVDILIGTHRLLSKDLAFRDLGLLVIDEEQRFGVRHKERLKQLRAEIDVLTLSATPIPRTLYMAMVGARDMSLITTPPKDRLPVRTEIVPFDEDLIRDAILREVDRGGQVFFVHNRVETIDAMAQLVRRVLPELRIAVGHGQMSEHALEDVMVRFLAHEFDVLVATMIIESGLDFPNVNTIIINRADRFGLAQLYQLRGRVGRSRHRAYAYLLIPRGSGLTSEARRRLQTIEEFDHLGAGYQIAMRDLELRGAGNILGREQHGQIAAVGFDLYTRMLKETVAQLAGEEVEEERPVSLEVPVKAFLPGSYVEDADERMTLYRRIVAARTEEVLDDLEAELADRFGPLPAEGAQLLLFARLRVLAAAAGVARLGHRKGKLSLQFHEDRIPDRTVIGRLVGTFPRDLEFNSAGGFSIRLDLRREEALEEGSNLLRILVNRDNH